MNNMAEEGSGDCLICFSKIENCDVLLDDEYQKIINNCWKYLHKNIGNSKLQQTDNSIDDKQQQCCKKCFDATSKLIQLSEQVKIWNKQISDLSFEFSLGVMYRRTEVESLNSKSDDLSKDFVMLDVSRISPSLFTMDEPAPTPNMMEKFEHPSENNCVEKDAVLNIPQPLKIGSNEYFENNSLVLECPDEEGANLIKNPLVEAQNIQDGVKISKKTLANYPSNRTDVELIDNITSQIDESRSAAVTNGGETNRNKAAGMNPNRMVLLPKVKASSSSDVSKKFNSTSCSQKRRISHPLGSKSSKVNNGKATTSSNIILKKSNRNLKKSSTEVHKKAINRQTNHKCGFCEKVFTSPWYLESHIRVHTREKPFKSSFCVKAFSRSTDAKKHEIMHISHWRAII